LRQNFFALDIPTILLYLLEMAQIELILNPIGVIRTPFKSKYGAPRQPATAHERSVGVITLEEGSSFEQALEDLSGFEYVWVLFWFHKNKNWKPKVLPPHGGRKKRGLFSTRSPHRPNPIGLSLCKLLGVKGRIIRIENPDMLDGTPVLDIKPYLPHAESHPEARGGWIHGSNEQSAPLYQVSFSPEVRDLLLQMKKSESQELTSYLTGLLSRDPHPHVYRRIKNLDDGSAVIAVRRWRFQFRIEDMAVRVFGVERARDKRGKS
jgi:tRNA-Thr(GGU) m(6)t(6)A37 methyltransferase TsaA